MRLFPLRSSSIPAARRRPSRRVVSGLSRAATVGLVAAAWITPTAARAHGGTTVASGQRSGVTVLVQGSDSTTRGGKPAADLATTLAGPGSGKESSLVYYVRPSGGRSFRVQTERDASGVHHADVPTVGRGAWRDWDVSAIVTLSDGKRLRVTNASSNPPGPDPAARATPEAPATTPGAAAAPSSPTLSEGPTTPDVVEEPADQPVDDISGEEDAAPAWVLPSLALLVGVGAAAWMAARRRRFSDED